MAESSDSEASWVPADLTARILSALNHPIRIRILEALARRQSSAPKLSRALRAPLSNVSYHLCRVLFEELSLVTVVERHQRRGTEERVFALKRECFVGLLLLRVASAAEAPTLASLYASVAVDEDGQREIGAAIVELAETVTTVERRCADSDPRGLRQLVVGTAAIEAASLSPGAGR